MTVETRPCVIGKIPIIGSEELKRGEEFVARPSDGFRSLEVHDWTVSDGDNLTGRERVDYHFLPGDSAVRVVKLHRDQINKAHLIVEGSGRWVKQQVHWRHTK